MHPLVHCLVVATERLGDMRRDLPLRYLVQRLEPLPGPRVGRLQGKQTEILGPVAPLRTVDLQHPSLVPYLLQGGHFFNFATRHSTILDPSTSFCLSPLPLRFPKED